MFQVEFVMDSGSYEYPMPAVPREGDTVRLFGEVRKVTQVMWEPTQPIGHATVFLGERR